MSRFNIDEIPNASDKAKQAISNINAGFDEAQRRVDEAQRLADFVAGKPPKSMANQHHGIVHGCEYVISAADDKARRELLDRLYESENVTGSIGGGGNVAITINTPKGS